jgi:sugar transferase (PEP-CTERM/EpsH1 system associated)
VPRLLLLAHRIPYPPNKGEKIRSFHMLRHLARHFEIECGCLVDDPADRPHIATLRQEVAHLEAHETGRPARAVRSLLTLRPGRPMSVGWFHEPRLARWVSHGLASGRYEAVLVCSSAMAPYVMGHPRHPVGQRRVLDLVDIDSEKFVAYAATGRGPMRFVHAREGRTLLALERRAAIAFDQALFVSAREAERFTELAPETRGHVGFVENGVDSSRFDPAQALPSPYPGPGPRIVFTGAMGYRPNVEAVTWFAEAVLPRLRERSPPPMFHIVGANPAPAVRALAQHPGVLVAGTVPDIRPWLAHADVAVAPLLIARGIQNKVLEAMAMARPVVATTAAFEGVKAVPGRDLLVADGAEAFAAAVARVLDGGMPGIGAAGRAAMLAGHDWAATLAPLDRMLGGA